MRFAHKGISLYATSVSHVTRVELVTMDAGVFTAPCLPAGPYMKRIVLDEIEILGNRANPHTAEAALALLVGGRVDLTPLLTHRFPWRSSLAPSTCSSVGRKGPSRSRSNRSAFAAGHEGSTRTATQARRPPGFCTPARTLAIEFWLPTSGARVSY
jgi:hypothetical protein